MLLSVNHPGRINKGAKGLLSSAWIPKEFPAYGASFSVLARASQSDTLLARASGRVPRQASRNLPGVNPRMRLN